MRDLFRICRSVIKPFTLYLNREMNTVFNFPPPEVSSIGYYSDATV